MFRRCIIIAGLFVVALGGVAQANIIGDEITGEFLLEGSTTNLFIIPTSVVGDGVEFTIFLGTSQGNITLEYDFQSEEDLFVTYTFAPDDGETLSLPAHTVSFDDFDWLDENGDAFYGAVTNFTLVNAIGIAPGVVSTMFTPTGVGFGIPSTMFTFTNVITLTFNTTVTHEEPVVPEPATITLLGLGLAGLGLARKRMR